MRYPSYKLTILFTCLLVLLTLPIITHAGTFQDNLNAAIDWGKNPSEGGLSNLPLFPAAAAQPSILTYVANILINLTGFLSIIGIIVGGLLYALASGDEKKISAGKRIIMLSLAGLFIILIRLSVVSIIYNITSSTAPAGVTLPLPTNYATIIGAIETFLLALIKALFALFIIIGGIMYMTSIGDEQKTAKAKKTIFGAIAGLFIALIAGTLKPIIVALAGGSGDATTIETLINAIISFLQALIAIVSTLFIIIGGFLYITSAGDEQKTAKAKKTIFTAAAGLFIAFIADIIKDATMGIAGAGGPADPSELRTTIKNLITYTLSFTSIAAVAAFIYGGFTYITSSGNDEKTQRGKKIIIYTIIGIVFIMISALIVNIVLTANP